MNCIFIYNPFSGKGKINKQQNYIANRLLEKFEKVTIYPTRYAGHAYKLALEFCNEYDCIIIGGGDGTLNEVINAVSIANKKPLIGYIPAGTVNDCAHTLGIPKNIKKALDIIIAGNTKDCDILKVNDKYGIYVCCTGLFTNASYATKQGYKNKIGKLAYFLHGVKSLFKYKPIHLTATTDNVIYDCDTALMLLLNSKSVAGFNINPKAKIDDGLVDVVFVKNKNPKKITMSAFLSVCKIFLFGIKNVKSNKKFYKTQLSHINIECNDSTAINIDGENLLNGRFNLSVQSKFIKIFTPKEN